MRKLVILAFSLVLLASLASAQMPFSGNVYVGYSYYNTNLTLQRQGINGFDASVEGKLLPFLGIVVDYNAAIGTLNFPNPSGSCIPGFTCVPVPASTTIQNILAGPRVSVSLGRLRPFAEGMGGFGNVSTKGFGNNTGVAAAFGGGFDYRIVGPISFRFEGDYIHTSLFGTTQKNGRFSTGVVFRF